MIFSNFRTQISKSRAAVRAGLVSRHALAGAVAPLVLLAGCSGGGGSSPAPAPAPTPTPSPTPAPTNSAPVFTSAATATVTENTTAAYQAAASDANGDAITYSISGGADAALFAITPAGTLTFKTAPTVAAPKDANADNVYAVQIGASDGKATSTLDVAITVTSASAGFKVVRVATGLTQPTFIAPVPGDAAHVFLTEKTGKVYMLTPATGATTLLFDAAATISTDGERGVVGLAASPFYATTKEVFVHATAPDGAVEIRQYKVGDPNFGGTSPYRVVVSTPHAGAPTHNGGWIAFGPDGYLYDAVGDGGTGGQPAQDKNSRLGKILRIQITYDANKSAQSFAPAPGNPFINADGDDYVFAMGLRNPFRASFAPDGQLVIADVGENTSEEIDLMPVTQAGLNFGWPLVEGDKTNTDNPPAGLIAPVTLYRHDGAPEFTGNSITGGVVYRGPVASLRGQYLFADWGSNNIWSVPYASLLQAQAQKTIFPSSQFSVRTDIQPTNATIRSIVCFGEDTAGNVYIIDLGGHVYEILPN